MVVKIRSRTLFFAKRPLIAAFLLWVGLWLASCSASHEDALIFSGPTMGTRYNITLVPQVGLQKRAGQESVQADVDRVLQQINQSMSTYISDSEVSTFNRFAVEQWFDVSADLCRLLQISQDISELSGGRFDPTVGPLVNLWGFGPIDVDAQGPEQSEIEAMLERTGYTLLEIDCAAQRIKKLKDIYLDLSAIAKGYAVDRLADYLLAAGWQRFMIEIGGEIRTAGLSHRGEPWRIGVELPSLLRSEVMQAIAIENGAIATSGDYRNYREIDGKRLSHTIDPGTGRPVEHRLASVTVVAQTAAQADALATAINVMGPDQGFTFAQQQKLAAFFIIRESKGFSVKYTTEFETYRVNL